MHPQNPENPLSIHIRLADLDTRITPITTRKIILLDDAYGENERKRTAEFSTEYIVAILPLLTYFLLIFKFSSHVIRLFRGNVFTFLKQFPTILIF